MGTGSLVHRVEHLVVSLDAVSVSLTGWAGTVEGQCELSQAPGVAQTFPVCVWGREGLGKICASVPLNEASSAWLSDSCHSGNPLQ